MTRLSQPFLRRGFRLLCGGVVTLGRLFYGLKVDGLEHLPAKGPLVIVGRRISRVDFFGAAFLLSFLREVSGMTGALAMANSRFIAWAGREMGFLPTSKGKSFSAPHLLAAYELLKQGKIIIMADEGEIPWDGCLQPLRSGATWLALRAHVPVVGLLMHGGYDIWPRWASVPHLSGKLTLKIGKPFYICEAPCPRVTRAMLEDANRHVLAALEVISEGYMLSRGRRA